MKVCIEDIVRGIFKTELALFSFDDFYDRKLHNNYPEHPRIVVNGTHPTRAKQEPSQG